MMESQPRFVFKCAVVLCLFLGPAVLLSALNRPKVRAVGISILNGRASAERVDEEVQHVHLLSMASQLMEANINKRGAYVSRSGLKIEEMNKVGIVELMEYWQPVYPCYREVRYGKTGEGGKWICNGHRLSSQSVVYSVGSSARTDFEEDLFQQTGAEIHVFDCTLDDEKTRHVESLSHVFQFHPICLGPETLTDNRDRETMSMEDAMAQLGHTFIDILKVDCEGCEFTSFKKVFTPHDGAPVAQFLLESHNRQRNPDGSTTNHTNIDHLLKELEEAGLRLFHVEPNWRWWPGGIEWAFVNPLRLT